MDFWTRTKTNSSEPSPVCFESQKRGEIASSTMKIAAEKSRSTACSSATVTETRSTSQLKNIRPNYFVSLPIKNENIKWAIKIFEEFFKKNASGMTGYQKVQTLAVVLSSRALRTNFRSFKIIWFLGTLDGGGVSSGRKWNCSRARNDGWNKNRSWRYFESARFLQSIRQF